ncbi:MAG: hypothetical protein RR740_00310 [Pseudomonas sp.]
MNYDKPGCFGSAITYNPTTRSCKECPDAPLCCVSARQRIEQVRSLVSVEAVLKVAHKAPQKPVEAERFDLDLPAAAQKLIAMIPHNAQRTAAALVRTKINLRKALTEGSNPIRHQKPLAVSVLFDLLLLGEVDRSTYMLELKDKLGHSPATAASQASIGFAVVTGLGIALFEGDKLMLRR